MLILYMQVAVICTNVTSWLIRKKQVPPVRASSMLTLFTVSTIMLINRDYGNQFAPVILGSTFVGMSESHRLRLKSLTFASLVFSLVFYFVVPYNPGFGGALGLAAFTSCILIYGMKNLLNKKQN